MGFIKYQLRRLAWSFIVLVFTFVFSFVQIYNLFKGIYWVIFPLLCVPVNTTFAMMVGFFIGKTPLNNKNMPTKTLEGYIGGIILTAIWAFYASQYLTKFQYLCCS
jgi:phosphatidate cytidylyltransferase